MDGKLIKNDFENTFLASFGETFKHVRNDVTLGTIRVIRDKKYIECSSDEDIQPGDMLVSVATEDYFYITNVSYEVVNNVKTSMYAYFLS